MIRLILWFVLGFGLVWIFQDQTADLYIAPYWWVPYLVYLVLAVISYFLMPKPKTATPVAPKPYGIEDFQVPTASAGREIPGVFGTRWVGAPNVVWDGGLLVGPKKETSCG